MPLHKDVIIEIAAKKKPSQGEKAVIHGFLVNLERYLRRQEQIIKRDNPKLDFGLILHNFENEEEDSK